VVAGETLLAARGLTKGYGGTVVLRDVDFTLAAGESVAVIGENGAGKSTFAKIIAGVVVPDDGDIVINGEQVAFRSPRDALRHGIAFIPQELAFVPHLTVAENLLLGHWPSTGGVTSPGAIRRRAAGEIARFGLPVDLDKRVSMLKLVDQQIVEILKALIRRAAVILLDEPTASLSEHETQILFAALERLAAQSVGIVYISHRMDEVYKFSDRVDVFRNGERVVSVSPASTTPKELIAHMLGRESEELEGAPERQSAARPVLSLRGWHHDGQPLLDGIGFDVGEGEVVGIFGVRGSGAELVAEGLAGRHRDIEGEVEVRGRRYRVFRSPQASRRAKIGYVPADRKKEGIVLIQSIQANLSMLVLRRLQRFGVLRRRLEHSLGRRLADQFDVRMRRLSQPVWELSGGNQQKVLLGSRLAARPAAFVLQEPTRGVDVGARLQIHRFLREIAAEGAGVLLVTSDVEEAVVVSDRLLVMREGRIVAELEGERRTQSRALRAAAGAE
jgi:ABC-type sugar transport system ATPase subunit